MEKNEERFAEVRIVVSTNDLELLNGICSNHIEWVLDLDNNTDIINYVDNVKVLELERHTLVYDSEKNIKKDLK